MAVSNFSGMRRLGGVFNGGLDVGMRHFTPWAVVLVAKSASQIYVVEVVAPVLDDVDAANSACCRREGRLFSGRVTEGISYNPLQIRISTGNQSLILV